MAEQKAVIMDADGVRRALDMDAVYAAMGLKNPKGASL